MSKKNLVLVVMMAMVFMVVLKIGLLFTTNKEIQLGVQPAVVVLPAELESLRQQILDESLAMEKRFMAVDAMTLYHDKDLALVTLEKIEEGQKTTPVGDRLRRAVVALRYNKPIEDLKKNEPSSY